jgi:hypothetical protein
LFTFEGESLEPLSDFEDGQYQFSESKMRESSRQGLEKLLEQQKMNYTVTNNSRHQEAQSQENLVNSLLLFKFPFTARSVHTYRASVVQSS